MEYVMIGKFTSTHGLKGELKILSNTNEINDIIKVDNTIYVGNKKRPFVIKTHRLHQKYNMVTIDGIDSIDLAIPFKNLNVFVNKEDIKIDLIENLIGFDVYNNDVFIGKLVELLSGVKYDLFVVGEERIIIPNIDNFVISIDKDKKVIKTNYMI